MTQVTYADGRIEQEVSVSTDDPVVGMVLTPDRGATVPAAILRARQHGWHTIVTTTDPDLEWFAVVQEMDDVLTVSPTDLDTDGVTDPWENLTRTARSAGFPGVVAHCDPTVPVDYDASAQRLAETDRYSVEAVATPPVDTEATVLAAIPAFNEAAEIDTVVSSALEYADEVLVVDDGSTDGTPSIAREAGATVVEHERNRGYGGSLKTIFGQAARSQATHLVILDGDGQHDPADIPALVDAQRDSEAELVIGSRFAPGSETSLPAYRRVGLFVVNVLTNLSLGVVRPRSWVGDTQSGFRAYDRRAIESLAMDDSIGDEMGASTDILHHAHSHDYHIDEVGTTIDYDVDNASSQNPVTHGLHLVVNILRTVEEERPLSSLGLPGFASTIVGVGVAYLTMTTYIDAGTFPLGLALVSVFLTLAGIFACFTSIILHSLNRHVD
ncbi:glycosyltransferase family 2 protein [Natrarchaeobaculum aegyptiacum]|uniref:Dolichyl-phosphate beta-D-mannosyltransferase n=1 Tax=Natrarchaeobaculum aegyptiacum TaxID=745377 RepID=A0A2Z2HS92_9EURY|nr:glycosyltransferase family 2 protein [Natrarchaeobaculum aegyptiacum]ARS89972.1 dolichyl-phosphate beta-D-mannosyltransferase [Natrarchaeobaculum aegyptiacum]